MTVKERHFKWGWKDKSAIEVQKYGERGYDLNYWYFLENEGEIPSEENVELARREAYKQEKSCREISILYLDADNAPDTSRNAPISIETMEKKRIDNTGHYPWSPMTQKDDYDYRKQAERDLKPRSDAKNKVNGKYQPRKKR